MAKINAESLGSGLQGRVSRLSTYYVHIHEDGDKDAVNVRLGAEKWYPNQ